MDKKRYIVLRQSSPIVTPPIPEDVRRVIGKLLKVVQLGGFIEMPQGQALPSIGPRIHELRVKRWRVIYRIDPDAVIVAEVWLKQTNETPDSVRENVARRFAIYDAEQETKADNEGSRQ